MGNQLNKQNVFPLAQLPAKQFEQLVNDTYTVIRSSGNEEEGFRIPQTGHNCSNGSPSWHGAMAWDGQKDSQTISSELDAGKVNVSPFKKWKVHLVKYTGDPAENCCSVCGWRTMMPESNTGPPYNNRSFWPTRLTTKEQKEEWWTSMDVLLNSLRRAEDFSPEERAKFFDF